MLFLKFTQNTCVISDLELTNTMSSSSSSFIFDFFSTRLFSFFSCSTSFSNARDSFCFLFFLPFLLFFIYSSKPSSKSDTSLKVLLFFCFFYPFFFFSYILLSLLLNLTHHSKFCYFCFH